MNFDFSPQDTVFNPENGYFQTKGSCNYQNIVDAIIIKAKHAHGERIELSYNDKHGRLYTVKAYYKFSPLDDSIEDLKAGKYPLNIALFDIAYSNTSPVLNCFMRKDDGCYITWFYLLTDKPNATVANINSLLRYAGYQEAFCNDTRNSKSLHAFSPERPFRDKECLPTYDISRSITVGYRDTTNEIERFNSNPDIIIHPTDIVNMVKCLTASEMYDLIVNYKVYSREIFLINNCYGLRAYNSAVFGDIFQPWFREKQKLLRLLSVNARQEVIEDLESKFFKEYIEKIDLELLGDEEELTKFESMKLWHDHEVWPLYYTKSYGDVVLKGTSNDGWYYRPLCIEELKELILLVKSKHGRRVLETIDMTDYTPSKAYKTKLIEGEFEL